MKAANRDKNWSKKTACEESAYFEEKARALKKENFDLWGLQHDAYISTFNSTVKGH